MSATEDKEFNFYLRDKLSKYCDDGAILLSLSKPRNHRIVLDMIVYSSLGDEEQGMESVKETHNFLMAYQRHMFWGIWGVNRADDLMWEFWKSCFIRVKMAMDSGNQAQIRACKDYARYPKAYAAHVQNFVGSKTQRVNYLEEQSRVWANDSKGVNDFLSNNRQE